MFRLVIDARTGVTIHESDRPDWREYQRAAARRSVRHVALQELQRGKWVTLTECFKRIVMSRWPR